MDIKEYISSGIIESYVLGLATEEEVSILECIRKNNPEVQQAILDTQLLMEELATHNAVMPEEKLKEILWDQLSKSPAETSSDLLNKEVPFHDPQTDKQTIVLLRQPLWIAASVIVAISLAANAYLMIQRTREQQKTQHAIIVQEDTKEKLRMAEERWQVLQRPSVKTIKLLGVEKFPDGSAVILWDTETSNVFLAAANLPIAPAGKQYQLWAIVDGQPVNAGILPLSRVKPLLEMHRIPKAQSFAITLEKTGGSVTPTLSEMYVIGNI